MYNTWQLATHTAVRLSRVWILVLKYSFFEAYSLLVPFKRVWYHTIPYQWSSTILSLHSYCTNPTLGG